MKLINNFFYIISTASEEGTYRCKVKLNAFHDFYRVHFPGNPVTPGVCLVQMAAEILEQRYSRKFMLCKASNIKFKKLVGPQEEPEFVFTKIVMTDEQLCANVSVEDSDIQFVKMSLHYKIID